MLPDGELPDCVSVVPSQHLRDSDAEEKRVIYNALDQGLCTVEVKFEAQGRPADFVFLEVNASFERLTGMADAAGQSVRTLLPGIEQHWFDIYGEIARTGEPKRFVAEAAALQRWFEVHAFRVGDPGQNRVAILFEDVTERKRKEEHYALLNREIDHRARNMLTLLAALIRLTDAETVDGYKHSLLGRLDALARSQQVLSDGGGDFASYGELVEAELAPYQVDDRVRYAGPAVQLGKTAMQCLAMAMHELATNSVKHGALSCANGTVSIAWAQDGNRLRTKWSECGGPPVTAPARQGVGTSVIGRCIRDQLGGTVAFDWRAEGLCCELVVPLGLAASGQAHRGPAALSPSHP